jgi:hypothetical protein
MTLMEELMKRIRFQVVGQLTEPLRIVDSQSGEISRFIRIEGLGKTYSFRVDTDEELHVVPSSGWVRAGGVLIRRSKTTAANPRIGDLVWPGKPGWKQPTDEEYLGGCKFGGWGVIAQKRSGEYRGSPYRNLQLNVVGDTLLFRGIDVTLFDRLPESGPLYVMGSLETLLTTDNGRSNVDSIFSLENFK